MVVVDCCEPPFCLSGGGGAATGLLLAAGVRYGLTITLLMQQINNNDWHYLLSMSYGISQVDMLKIIIVNIYLVTKDV